MSNENILLCLSRSDIEFILGLATHAATTSQGRLSDKWVGQKNNLEARLLLALESESVK